MNARSLEDRLWADIASSRSTQAREKEKMRPCRRVCGGKGLETAVDEVADKGAGFVPAGDEERLRLPVMVSL
jgi:hypothetical protein